MNPPNTLTMSRIGMAVLLLVFLTVPIPYGYTIALILFVLAGITDYLDGHLARNVYGVTSFGKLMDPLADKVITCVAFVCFIEIQLPSYPNDPIFPAWMVVIIISREFLVTGLRLLAAGKGKLISAGQWGKHKTVWQIITITAVLLGLAVRNDILRHASSGFLSEYDFIFHWITLGLGCVVVVITVISGYKYFSENFDLIQHSI